MTRLISHVAALAMGLIVGGVGLHYLREDAPALETVVLEVGLDRTPTTYRVLYRDDRWRLLTSGDSTDSGLSLHGPGEFRIDVFDMPTNRIILLTNQRNWRDAGVRLVDFGPDSNFEVVTWNGQELPIPQETDGIDPAAR